MVRTAEIVEVIRVTECRGAGTAEDRDRNVEQYWTKDGRLLVELDSRDRHQGDSPEALAGKS